MNKLESPDPNNDPLILIHSGQWFIKINLFKGCWCIKHIYNYVPLGFGHLWPHGYHVYLRHGTSVCW